MQLVTLVIIVSVAALSATLEVTEEELQEWEAFKVMDATFDRDSNMYKLSLQVTVKKQVPTEDVNAMIFSLYK